MYFNNILIAGCTKEERNIALKEVLKKAKEINIKCNPNKFQSLGFIFNSEGVEPDNDRIASII